MTLKTCDLCGAETDLLMDVRDVYQTENIKQVCHECETLVNKALLEMKAIAQNFVEGSFKTFLRTLREKFQRRVSSGVDSPKK